MHQKDNLDGVVEVFKDDNKMGYVMKIYKSYEPDSDLCIWSYEDLYKKTIHIVIGRHINCDKSNNWIGEDLKYKEYLVKIDVKQQIVSDLSDYIYNYYDKNIRI